MSRLSELGKTKVPFGKHKGKPIDGVPLKYLDWLLGSDGIQRHVEFLEALTEYMSNDTIKLELAKELGDD